MLQRSRVLGVSVILVAGVMLSSHAPVVSAYGVKTHESLSEEAAVRSKLDQGILHDLGLASLKTKISGRSITEWIMRGADFEDNTIPLDDSANQTWARYRNHFYNPITGEGYKYKFLEGRPSPAWGLEDQGDIPGQNNSLKDAYDFLRDALTLPTKTERDAKFTELFQTLGHTVHLLQDAAQPQHTRNDSHALGSLYEDYTNLVAGKKGANGLPFGTYPVPSFPTARNFFHTESPDAGNVLVGKGMAEYSNRGFITTGTNFEGTPGSITPNANFPTPDGNGATIETISIRDAQFKNYVAAGLDGDITFIKTTVPDTNQPGETGPIYTSTYSIFQPDLEAYLGGSPGDPFPPAVQKARFTFNTINARAAQNLLIPRAVSYSAGLINWFFRGKIDMVKDPTNANQYLIKNLGTEPLQGTFTLYYDDVNDVRKFVDGAHWSTATLTSGNQLDAGAAVTVLAFAPPTDAKTANTYMLVFKGKIGAEISSTDDSAISIAAKTLVLNTSTIIDLFQMNYSYWDGHFVPNAHLSAETGESFVIAVNADRTVNVYSGTYYSIGNNFYDNSALVVDRMPFVAGFGIFEFSGSANGPNSIYPPADLLWNFPESIPLGHRTYGGVIYGYSITGGRFLSSGGLLAFNNVINVREVTLDRDDQWPCLGPWGTMSTHGTLVSQCGLPTSPSGGCGLIGVPPSTAYSYYNSGKECLIKEVEQKYGVPRTQWVY